MGAAFAISRRHSRKANSLIFWPLQSSCSIFPNVPQALSSGVFCRCAETGAFVSLAVLELTLNIRLSLTSQIFGSVWLLVIFLEKGKYQRDSGCFLPKDVLHTYCPGDSHGAK